MSGGSRWLVAGVLLATALWLHWAHCSWTPMKREHSRMALLAGWTTLEQWQMNVSGGTSEYWSGWGVWARVGVSKPEGITLGIVVPAALAATAGVLLVRGRRVDRQRKGACVVCGYALGPSKPANCPECGAPVVAKTHSP